MLQLFRQRGLSNVIYGAVISATILAFVITFRPNSTSRTASLAEACAARVRGRCIDPKDFGAAYRMLLPIRSSSVSRKLNLKRVALDGLVERELLRDEAMRLGLTVTDRELTDQLFAGFVRVSVPAADPSVLSQVVLSTYQSYARAGFVTPEVAQARVDERDTAIPVDFRDPKTKTFDMRVYERRVREISNRSTAEFREEQARELLAAKMRDVIREPVRVSESEAWQDYERRYSTATVGWISISESWAQRWLVNPAPSDVATWAEQHREDVDKAVAERAKEDSPKDGHLRHVLVKLPYGASDEDKALALGKLSWAAARVKAGELFAEVARRVSDDSGSASRGGDIGDKTDAFVAPFKAAADALKPGEITGSAIETQFGYHLIERDDPARAPDVEAQVKREGARVEYIKANSADAAASLAKAIAEGLRKGMSEKDAISAAESPFVREARVEPLRVVVAPVAVTADAGVSDATADSAGASPASPVRAPIRRYDVGTDTEAPTLQTSSAFNRGGDPFPGLSPEGTASVVSFAFESKDGDVIREPVRTAGAFVVVKLNQHKSATRDEFAKERDTFIEGMLRTKRDEALSFYVRKLRSAHKDDIKIDSRYVEEPKADAGGGGVESDEDEY
jgi:peptidyl-prolyl cis-trans isomerase D